MIYFNIRDIDPATIFKLLCFDPTLALENEKNL